jgi:hypothetical protein
MLTRSHPPRADTTEPESAAAAAAPTCDVPLAPTVSIEAQRADPLCRVLLALLNGQPAQEGDWAAAHIAPKRTATAVSNGEFALDADGRACHVDRRRGAARMAVVAPEAARHALWSSVHGPDELAQPGRKALLARIRDIAWWPKLGDFTKAATSGCNTCKRAKHPAQHRGRGELHQRPPATRFGDEVAIDLGGMAGPEGAHTFACVRDKATGWIVAWVAPSTAADKVAAQFETHWLRPWGVPRIVISDNGPEMARLSSGAMARRWGFAWIHETTAPQRPQSNGSAEKAVDMIKTKIRCLMMDAAVADHSRWPEFLAQAVSALNASPVATTGVAPFRALTGAEWRSPTAAAVETTAARTAPLTAPTKPVTEEEAVQHTAAIEQEQAVSVQRRAEAIEPRKRAYEASRRAPYSFAVGDTVGRLVQDTERKSKTATKYTTAVNAGQMDRTTGPYTIVSLESGGRARVHNDASGASELEHADRLFKWMPEVVTPALNSIAGIDSPHVESDTAATTAQSSRQQFLLAKRAEELAERQTHGATTRGATRRSAEQEAAEEIVRASRREEIDAALPLDQKSSRRMRSATKRAKRSRTAPLLPP